MTSHFAARVCPATPIRKGLKLGFARGAMPSWSSFPRSRHKEHGCTLTQIQRPARSVMLLNHDLALYTPLYTRTGLVL